LFLDALLPVNAEGYIEPYQPYMSNGYQFNLNRDYLSPIPTIGIVLNPNLKQTPSW
jgi:hypothetical protein